jgi:hypothetical protein
MSPVVFYEGLDIRPYLRVTLPNLATLGSRLTVALDQAEDRFSFLLQLLWVPTNPFRFAPAPRFLAPLDARGTVNKFTQSLAYPRCGVVEISRELLLFLLYLCEFPLEMPHSRIFDVLDPY